MSETKTGKQVMLFTTAIIVVVVTLVATVIPIIYFNFGLNYHQGKVSVKSEQLAAQISTIVSQNPKTWEFRVDHIRDLVARSIMTDNPQRIMLLNDNGNEVLVYGSSDQRLGFPIVEYEEPVYDSGHQAGLLLYKYSLSSLLNKTLAVFAVSILFGIIIFLCLRTLPLRSLKKTLEHLSFLALYDPLTGIPNRATFTHRLEQAIKDADQHGGKIAVLALDIDKFKDINDSLGHHSGDEVLKEMTRRLQSCIRGQDLLSRLSGDEFAIVQPNVDSVSVAVDVAIRITEILSKPMIINDKSLNVSTSIGIAIYPQDAESATNIMINADLALYHVKKAGRGAYMVFHTDMADARLRLKAIELALRKAVISEQFKVYYQPQVSLKNGKVIGVEALIRWIHPEWGFVSPEEFIAVAEDIDMINTIGAWVLKQACKDASDWGSIKLAVNLSPRQFHTRDLACDISSILSKTGFPASRLELEITEGVLINDNDSAHHLLNDLKAMGISIAMDDFGTGYSSLSYLQAFPFDKIKIDRSFISTETHNEKKEAIVLAAVGLGSSLGMRVNAEGIETQEQSARLQKLGCDEAQGYLFSPAVPANEIPALLKKVFAVQIDTTHNNNVVRLN